MLDGGAKQALHYTDVSPAVIMAAVTKGGNHIFARVFGANSRAVPELKLEALRESIEVFGDEIMSDIYVGWARGYLDEERARLEDFVGSGYTRIKIDHPRRVLQLLVEDLRNEANVSWFV